MIATRNNITRHVPEGFSWTTFFFGFLVFISRGMWPQAAISFFTFGFANFYYMFSINRLYAEKLQEEGWELSK
jgi:uncharacterized paraquat-inducible protein A